MKNVNKGRRPGWMILGSLGLLLAFTSCQDEVISLEESDYDEELQYENPNDPGFEYIIQEDEVIGYMNEKLEPVTLNGHPMAQGRTEFDKSAAQRLVWHRGRFYKYGRNALYGGTGVSNWNFNSTDDLTVSSLTLPPGCNVVLYDGQNQTGASISFNGYSSNPRYIADLDDYGWNNRARSFRTTCSSNTTTFLGYAYDKPNYDGSGASLAVYKGSSSYVLNTSTIEDWGGRTIESFSHNALAGNDVYADAVGDSDSEFEMVIDADVPNMGSISDRRLKFFGIPETTVEKTDYTQSEFENLINGYKDELAITHVSTTVSSADLSTLCDAVQVECREAADAGGVSWTSLAGTAGECFASIWALSPTLKAQVIAAGGTVGSATPATIAAGLRGLSLASFRVVGTEIAAAAAGTTLAEYLAIAGGIYCSYSVISTWYHASRPKEDCNVVRTNCINTRADGLVRLATDPS